MGERLVRFADLCDNKELEIGAGRPRSEALHLPVLRVADVLEGRIQSPSQACESTTQSQKLGPKTSRPGDIVLTVKGTVGRVAIMPPDGSTFAYSPQLCFFRPTAGGSLKPRYLYYWLKSEEFWKQVRPLKAQTDMADFLSLGDLNSLTVLVPPARKQQAIAEVLGAFDDKIAANDRIAKAAIELARWIYRQNTMQFPESRLSSVLLPRLGGTPKRSDESLWGGGIPWASARDVTGAPHGIILSTSESITEVAGRAKRLTPLPAGSVVLTARGTVGEVARLGVAAAINQSCYGFVPDRIPGTSLFFAVENIAAQVRSMAHGSVFDTITMRTFDHVSVPDLSDRDWFLLEDRIAGLVARGEYAVAESSLLARTRDELLPLLMSGKIRVKDAGQVANGVL
ncbi:restriction endonuclease subunit S [Nocardioides sp. AE5]|uniref:restriction endonuclease subunit S n=1 Tax=Nocardioides sp. AE5 TaxID=2962573 RepID=UPI002881E4FD|nr:restriction endonuclease subunit S [Nocardioides sp. AE5]MDT0200374.1 restriction endonuclease subunit S [Nocardioides sp. AE5]